MDIEYPINFQNVLDGVTFFGIRDMFKYERWIMTNGTSEYDRSNNMQSNSKYTNKSWLIPREVLNSNLDCLKAAIIIQYKIKQKIKKDIELIRIHSNGQTREQISEFHGDFTYDGKNSGPSPLDRLTFILFTEPFWDIEWGGEFIAQNPETLVYYYTSYIPNDGVVVPSHWQHKGCSPNAHTDRLRTTLAFSYKMLDT
jgi:hypothetical protein